MQVGKASLRFEHPAFVASWASVAGKKEGQGPLADEIDVIEQDEMFGMENWEQQRVPCRSSGQIWRWRRKNIHRREVRYLFAGDLLGQLIATSFGTVDLEIPLFGLYGACSTMGEALGLGAMCVNAGYADRVLTLASSHYATAEKQFRFSAGIRNQRAQSATWTVTGCGAVVLGKNKTRVAVTGITTGKLVDMGTKDSMNMGAAMAPAAWNTIRQNFEDFGVDASYYDRIITGDLGAVGQKALLDFMKSSGYDITGNHMDCGLEIYDRGEQDVHSGGSGCGCSAVTLCARILPKLMRGEWSRVLFVPTGALLSTVSYNEGQSIPGIAHAVILERMRCERNG